MEKMAHGKNALGKMALGKNGPRKKMAYGKNGPWKKWPLEARKRLWANVAPFCEVGAWLGMSDRGCQNGDNVSKAE
jgi:hypothetical protein